MFKIIKQTLKEKACHHVLQGRCNSIFVVIYSQQISGIFLQKNGQSFFDTISKYIEVIVVELPINSIIFSVGTKIFNGL